MPPELTIRQYRPADRERVLELHEAAMRAAGSFVEGAPDPDLDDIPGSYLDASGTFLVGEAGDQICAMGAFRPVGEYTAEVLGEPPGRTAQLKRLRVDPAHQRQGYGQAIYDELERRARAADYSAFVLDTTPEQTAASEFYDQNGFGLAERREIEWEGEQLVLLFYRKSFEESAGEPRGT